MDVKQQLQRFILGEFLPGESETALRDDTPLRASGILDSLGLIKTVAFVEREFDIEVGVQEAVDANFGTIAQLAAYVTRKRAET